MKKPVTGHLQSHQQEGKTSQPHQASENTMTMWWQTRRNQDEQTCLALVLGTLSVSFLCKAPESRWLANRNILCAVYSLSHNIEANVGNFSSTKMCQGQKSFNSNLTKTTALRTTTVKFQMFYWQQMSKVTFSSKTIYIMYPSDRGSLKDAGTCFQTMQTNAFTWLPSCSLKQAI